MKHYTDAIPYTLAEKLKEKGMLMMSCFNITQTNSFSDDGGIHFYYIPSYAEAFDWLMDKGKEIEIFYVPARGAYMYGIAPFPDYQIGGNTWHEAANAAITKALELI